MYCQLSEAIIETVPTLEFSENKINCKFITVNKLMAISKDLLVIRNIHIILFKFNSNISIEF